jgi:hypothetical protein
MNLNDEKEEIEDDDEDGDDDDGPSERELSLLSKEEIQFRRKFQGVTTGDLETVLEAFIPLMKANPKDWFMSLWRTLPEFDSDGITCAGYMRNIKNKVIDHEWIKENHGGGTYSIRFHGAVINKHNQKKQSIIRTVQGIEISGPVKQNKNDSHYKKLVPREKAQEEQPDQPKQQEVMMNSIQDMLLKHQLEQNNRLEAKFDQATEKIQNLSQSGNGESHVNELRREMMTTIENLKEKLAEKEKIPDSGQNLKEIIEGLRKDNESLRMGNKDEVDKLRQTYENRITSLQEDHKEFRREATSNQSAITKDIRDQADLRMDQLKAIYEGQIRTMEQGYQTRIQLLEAQLTESKSSSNQTRKELDRARDEANKARIEGIQATIEAQNSKNTGLDLNSFQKTAESVQALSSFFGFKRDEPIETPGALDKVVGAVGEIARNDKFGALMETLAMRIGSGGQPQIENPLPNPTPQTIQWDSYKNEQLKKHSQNKSLIEQPPVKEPMVEQPITKQPNPPIKNPTPQPTTEDLSKQGIQEIEKAAKEKKPVAAFIEDLLKTPGVSREQLKFAAQALTPSQMLSQIGASEADLTLGGMAYFESVCSFIKSI